PHALLLEVPLLMPHLSSLWLHLVTPVKARVAPADRRAAQRDRRARLGDPLLVPVELTPFEDAAVRRSRSWIVSLREDSFARRRRRKKYAYSVAGDVDPFGERKRALASFLEKK